MMRISALIACLLAVVEPTQSSGASWAPGASSSEPVPASKASRGEAQLSPEKGKAAPPEDAAAVPQGEEPPVPTLTRAPEVLRFVEATYPAEARDRKIEGDVGLLIDIDADGSVMKAEVFSPAGHGFDEAALEAVRQFVFTPAEIDHQPAAVQIEYVYRFVFRPPPKAETPITLRGRVVERASRRLLAGVEVRCVPLLADGAALEHPEAPVSSGLEETVFTDADGRFAMRLPPGRYRVELISAPHARFHSEEAIAEGDCVEVTYHLLPLAKGAFHSVVRGRRERREATRRTLEREELQAVPGTMGDAVRVLQNLPGVARSAYLGGQLVVRGASPSETGSYLDGVEIPLLFHFFGGPSIINPEFIDHIDFLPGGFDARYGRATGGIVDARTRRGGTEMIHGSFKLDFIDAALFLGIPLGDKTSVALAARRSYVDALLAALTPETESFGTASVLPRYWDYQLRLDHGKQGDRHTFTAMVFGSDDQMTLTASGGTRDLDLDLGGGVGFHRLRAAWTFREGAFSNELAPFFGLDLAGLDKDRDGPSSIVIDSRGWVVGLRDEASYRFGARDHVARVGVDVSHAMTALSGKVPFAGDYRPLPGASTLLAPIEFERSLRATNAGLHTAWELNLPGGLQLMPGLRVDLFDAYGHTHASIDPRLSARWRVAEQTTVKGSVGHYSQPPALEYVDASYGNPELDFTKALQTSLGVEQQITQALSVDVTGFFIYGYDRVASSDALTRGDDGTWRAVRYVNGGHARNYGVELMVRHEMTERLFGWVAYTLSRSERRGVDADRYRRSSHDQTHILTALAQYRIGRGWSAGARFRLVSGNAVTPVLDSTFDADTGSHQPIYGELYSERAPLFHQLDLRVDKEWLFKAWKLGIYLDIQNVYWADNTEYVLWDYRYRGSTDLPGMPFLPSLGIKGSF